MNAAAVFWLLSAYLVGSIPFGVLVAKVFFRSDIRREGSGNIGAANALRSYGKTAGLAVLALDALKGFFVTWLSVPFGAGPEALAGFCAVLGHCYSPWLNFKGGKGVATWLGVLLALQPPAALAFVLVWLAIVLPTRYASLGSLVATVVSGAVLWWLEPGASVVVGGIALAATLLIFWKHRENIARLRAGTENKLVLRRTESADARTLPG